MIGNILFLEQHYRKCSLCSKTKPRGISEPAKPSLFVMDREEEYKLSLRHAAEFERLKQRLWKYAFTDQNLVESSEELECKQMPSWV